MNEPVVEDEGAQLWVDRGARRYAPGELLTGGYRLADWRDDDLTAIEFSVLWYTAGQGEEDFFVHHFDRQKAAVLPKRHDETPYRFEVVMPASPLSYDGQIVKVCWAARLRAFFRSGKQRVIETPFWLSLPSDKPPAVETSNGEAAPRR